VGEREFLHVPLDGEPPCKLTQAGESRVKRGITVTSFSGEDGRSYESHTIGEFTRWYRLGRGRDSVEPDGQR
jgi:hypothetical protein